MSEHKQMMIFNPLLNEVIEVDEGIAPLIKAIWNLGIATCNSCQENKPGVIWIEFSSAEDAEIFMGRIASGLDLVDSPTVDNRLYSRIMGQNGGWQYNAHPHDSREYIDEENGALELNASEPCKIEISISIRFPIKDYERVLDLVG
ncbi:MAG: hypothetical protein ACE14P_10675 [Methanotrichaceae archaeon]